MSKIRLSFSQTQTYNQCSEKWRLHYVERLRSPKLTSSLFFGFALDEAFSLLLLAKKEDLTDVELDLQLKYNAEELFLKHMQEMNSNGAIVSIPQNHLADYYASDFDLDLLTSSCISAIEDFAPNLGTAEEIAEYMEQFKASQKQKPKQKLDQHTWEVANYITWLSLVQKGYLMLQAYREQIMPQIEKVYSIQREILIENENGDSIIGKIDFEASFNADPGVVYICDNKSSSTAYAADSVLESEQLATYAEATGNQKAAYVVVQKKLFKKAPIVHTQVILGTVPEKTMQKVFDNYSAVLDNISAGVFEKNENSCFAYGKMCAFFHLCKHGIKSGLVDMKKEGK